MIPSTENHGGAWFRPATPRTDGGAAIAIIEVGGESPSIQCLGVPALDVGHIKRWNIMGIDDGLVARIAPTLWHFMPHGGPFVIRQICQSLAAAGLELREHAAAYPEAANEIEQRMLGTLARAESPRAISLLLKQPALWSRAGAANDPTRDAILNRLISAPLIGVLGGANIGKSSLANALARREVAIVADQPGTTRDHVGVWLDLDGVVVRWIDTPGMRATSDEIEAAAQLQAAELIQDADLVLLCGDITTPPPTWTGKNGLVRTVQLRSDLGPVPWTSDWAVSARSGDGLQEFAHGIREVLVPQNMLEADVPWKFWS